MIRILFTLTLMAVAGIAVTGVPDAAADTPDAAADTPAPPAPPPCPPRIQAAARAALPTMIGITCRAPAGASDPVKAEVVLRDSRMATLELSPDGKVLRMTYAHDDLVGSSGKGMALLFWAFALAAVGGALFVVTRKNLIAAVMGMVGSFLGIAAIYMMLYAQFLAVVQMLVYAGAIMVLFVFVVMILNRPEDEPVAPVGRIGQALGGFAIVYLVARLIMMLLQVQPPDPAIAMAAPRATAEGHDWGSVKAVGTDLFGPGLFPFEAISILLLVAVVGAIAIARPLHVEDDDPAKTRAQGGAA